MADFLTAYNKFVKPIEGGYVNNPADKGGETYAGITRKNFPTWSGWATIDKAKPLKTNQKLPELDNAVTNFYRLAQWQPNNFSLIKSQDVANILFDWFVNSGYSAFYTKAPESFGVNEILNRDFGYKLVFDGRLDTQTVNAINAVDPVKLYNAIKAERIRFYYNIVNRDPSQKVFLNGWINRINKFPDLVKKGLTGLSILVLLLVSLFIINRL